MSELDKDYMPLNMAIEKILPFLTQNMASTQAWHYTQDKANTLAHALQKGINEQNNQIEQLKAENKMLKQGMKGDYDLDRWLDWALEAEKILMDKAELIDAAQDVADCLILESFRIPGFTKRKIKSLSKTLAKHKGEM